MTTLHETQDATGLRAAYFHSVDGVAVSLKLSPLVDGGWHASLTDGSDFKVMERGICLISPYVPISAETTFDPKFSVSWAKVRITMPMPASIPLRAVAAEPRGVPSKATRRKFSAAEKLRIVREADACERGQVEAFLRREGVYSALVAKWRAALRLHGESGLQARKRGPVPTRDARDEQLGRLQRENDRLRAKLERAEAVIDLQKKVSALLGIELKAQEP